MLASFQSKPAETENNIAKKNYMYIIVWRPGIGVGVNQRHCVFKLEELHPSGEERNVRISGPTQ